MFKKILSILMISAALGMACVTVGCEDEVKVHRQSETTTVQQQEVVVP